jgi:hypothetical protein
MPEQTQNDATLEALKWSKLRDELRPGIEVHESEFVPLDADDTTAKAKAKQRRE